MTSSLSKVKSDSWRGFQGYLALASRPSDETLLLDDGSENADDDGSGGDVVEAGVE